MPKDKCNNWSTFFKSLSRPFKLCKENLSRSLLWVIYILIGGLMGVVINLIFRWVLGNMSFQEAIYVESLNGTFYTYSIVLISAAIGPLFFNLSQSRVLHFSNIKSFTLTIGIFAMFFCAIFYSHCVKDISSQLVGGSAKEYRIDWWQLGFFILAIVFALYSLGLEYLDEDPKNNKDIDTTASYIAREEETVENLETSNPQATGDGIKL